MAESAGVEIHDSRLERIEAAGESLIGTVSAYVHRSAGTPGVHPGTGWTQRVELRFKSGRVVEGTGEEPMDLLDGRLRTPVETFENMLPLPLLVEGQCVLELEGYNERRVS